jgi:ribosomal protein S6E (S10)
MFLKKACRHCNSDFSGSFNSKGFTLFLRQNTREDVLKAYKSFPRDLMHGSICAGALMYGGYGLFVEIGCIDADKVNALCKYLTGKTEAEARQAIEAAEAKAEKKLAEYKAKAESELKARQAKQAEVIARLQDATEGRQSAAEFTAGKFEIAKGFDESGALILEKIELAKRGACLCKQDGGKWRKYHGGTLALQSGLVFRIDECESEPRAKPVKPVQVPSKAVKEPSKANILENTVEWQGVESYVTQKGKVKPLLTGVPSQGFWLIWKHEKEKLKAMGVSIYCAERHKTGQFKTVRGKTFEIVRKSWIVQAWKPEAFGFDSRDAPKIKVDSPF